MEAKTDNEGFIRDIRERLDGMVDLLNQMKNEKEQGKPFSQNSGRELSLAVTNLQQARMWLGEALRTAGVVKPYPVN